MLPGIGMFAIAEAAAEEIAELDIRWSCGDTVGNIASDMSRMITDALRSNDTMELYRATIRVFTMDTTLYREMNCRLRLAHEMGEGRISSLEPEGEPGMETYPPRLFACLRRIAPDEHECLGFYVILLQQVLLRWPQRLGTVDVYRGVYLGEDDIEM
jgi:hypothetical protein